MANITIKKILSLGTFGVKGRDGSVKEGGDWWSSLFCFVALCTVRAFKFSVALRPQRP